MADLTAGLNCMHNGHAVRLIFLMGTEEGAELWWVTPLFVNEPERAELFSNGDPVSKLHARYA